MRRVIVILLAFVLFINATSISASASQDEHGSSVYYVDEYYEQVYELYEYFVSSSSWVNYLKNDDKFVYVQVAEQLGKSPEFQAGLTSVEFLTNAGWDDIFNGEYDVDDIKVQYYVTALSSLLMTMEQNWSDVKENQKKADATMTWVDYMAEGGSVAAGFLASKANGVWETAFSTCGLSIDLIGETIGTVEDYQKLEADAGTYLMYHAFLAAIRENTADLYLIEASDYLTEAVDLCYKYYVDHMDMVFDKDIDFTFSIFDKVLEELLKDPDAIREERAAFSCFNAIIQGGGSFKLGVDMAMFGGDVLIGTSDTMLRYYEMRTLTSVREALLKEISRRESQVSGKDDWEEIALLQDLIIDLIYVNVRGEYCAYSLTTNDMGLWSWLNVQINGREDEEWFNTVVNIAVNLQTTVEAFFPNWENYRKDEQEMEDSSCISNNAIEKYIPIIEVAIDESAYDYGTTGSGFLYDIDSDGIDELFFLDIFSKIGEDTFPAHAYSVYDIENGEVIAKHDKEMLFYDAGGPSGYIGVVDYKGSKAFLVYVDNGETGYQAHRESQYTIYAPDSFEIIASAYLEYVWDDIIQVNNCMVDGNYCSYNDYLNVVDAIQPIIIADIYANDSGDGSMDMHELLCYIQETCDILANQSLQDTKEDVEQVDIAIQPEIEPVESTAVDKTGVITLQELLGEWVVDIEYTMEYNDKSVTDFYGTSFGDGGNKMLFNEDGSYKYYVAWCYGYGTYEMDNNEVYIDLTEGDPIQGVAKLFLMTDGVTRIGLDQYGNGEFVFWKKIN